MAKKKNNRRRKSANISVVKGGNYSNDIRKIFTFLDSYSASSKKYNSLDIKVDSNLVKQK